MKEYNKICKLCGNAFVAKSKRAEVCKSVHTSVCAVCGAEFVRKPPYESTTCSMKCAQKLGNVARKQTCMSKYGVENPMQLKAITDKVKSSSIERYGVDNPSKSEEVKSKIKQTFTDKYGVTNAMQVDEFKHKQSASTFSHLGVAHPLQSREVLNKMQSTNLQRYGVTNILADPTIRQRIRTNYKQKTGYSFVTSNPEVMNKIKETCIAKYGVPYNCMRPECRSSYRTISKINLAFSEMLSQHNIEHEMESPIDRFSYDFKIENILVEIDPTITHNIELSIFPDSTPIAVSYHLEKTNAAISHGYRCIHVFDWDNWDNILHLLQPCSEIYARKCKVTVIDQKTANMFTSKYHINGRCNGQKINYGLWYNDELVEVMTFGKPRYNAQYDYELLRLCSKTGLKVVGGASKLFKHFLDDIAPSSVISYCDLSKFTGAVYTNIGMKLINTTAPNKIWSKGDRKITQNLLNQRGYDQLFNTDYGKGTSNEQLMLENGWLPVYDCGQLVFEYRQSTDNR